MFDRPQERRPKNTGRVDNRTENTVEIETESKNSYLYIIIGVLTAILLIVGGVFIFNLGKKINPSSNSQNKTSILEITATKIEKIPFQELVGKYTGSINNQTVTVNIFSEGAKKRYSYSKNNRISYMLSHFEETNEMNFHKPKEGLAQFTAFKEGNVIILRSANVELRKIK